MTISKAQWNSEGDSVRLSMPFSKVDKERRVVSGFATLDNVDRQKDIVTSEASVQAFSKFRGNIREMHQPLAVGKMIAFKEDKYFDPETKMFYSGVYVSAYVSKGAQDTWEKVLDGTLSGFSIGGKMNKWDDAYDEKMDSSIRIIKEYDLVELSLVDTPANQFANIMSVEKVDGVSTVKGESVNTQIENVFWDKESGLVLLSEEEVAKSPTSGQPMQNIGFVEKNDNEKTDMIKFLVGSAKGTNSTEIEKEVGLMTETTNEAVHDAPADEAVAHDSAVEKSQVAPKVETDTASADDAELQKGEVTTSVISLEEALQPSEGDDELSSNELETNSVSKLDDKLEQSINDVKDIVTKAFSELTAVVQAQAEQIAELHKSVATVKTDVTTSSSMFNEFGKRVDAVEADTAFRKSGDLGEILQDNQPEKVEKSLWGGRFLKTADLFR